MYPGKRIATPTGAAAAADGDVAGRGAAGLDGVHRLGALLQCGSGLRLLERLRLRVKDIEREMNQIVCGAARATRAVGRCCRRVAGICLNRIWRP